MRIYLAGPMRGLPENNFPAFDEAETQWRAAGWHVFSPANLWRASGWPIDGGTEEQRASCTHGMQLDLSCVYAADAIALLPGWRKSRGATVEIALAQVLGLPIYDAVTMLKMEHPPVLCPWQHCVEARNGDWGDVWRQMSGRPFPGRERSEDGTEGRQDPGQELQPTRQGETDATPTQKTV